MAWRAGKWKRVSRGKMEETCAGLDFFSFLAAAVRGCEVRSAPWWARGGAPGRGVGVGVGVGCGWRLAGAGPERGRGRPALERRGTPWRARAAGGRARAALASRGAAAQRCNEESEPAGEVRQLIVLEKAKE